MECPKCGLVQQQSPECHGCGVIIARYLSRQQASQSLPKGTVRRRGKATRYGRLEIDRELRNYYLTQATMLRAGLNAVDAHQRFLDEPGSIRDLLPYQRIATTLAAGDPTSQGMAQSASYFPVHHIRLIEAGEHSGNPEGMFQYLHDLVDQKISLIEGVYRELRKPMYTLVGSVFILPLPLLWTSGLLDYLGSSLLPLLMAAGLYYLIRAVLARLMASASFALAWDEWRLQRVSVYRDLQTNQFIRVFGALYSAGVNLADAWGIAANAVSNRFLRRVLTSHQHELEAGRPLAEVATETGAFERDLLQVISTGEAAGALDTALARHGKFVDEANRNRLRKYSTALTFVLGLTIAVYVGYRVVSGYSAMLPPDPADLNLS